MKTVALVLLLVGVVACADEPKKCFCPECPALKPGELIEDYDKRVLKNFKKATTGDCPPGWSRVPIPGKIFGYDYDVCCCQKLKWINRVVDFAFEWNFSWMFVVKLINEAGACWKTLNNGMLNMALLWNVQTTKFRIIYWRLPSRTCIAILYSVLKWRKKF